MTLRKISSSSPITNLRGAVDYNTLKTTGVFYHGSWADAKASPNGPGLPGLLEVYGADGMVFQKFIAYRDYGMYYRSYYGWANEWYPWRKLTAT